jgi:hypothetical protein
MNVELATLRAGTDRRLRLIDRGSNAVDVEDARQGQAAKACTDDRYGRHCHAPFAKWNVVPYASVLEQRSIHVKVLP